MGKKGKSSFKGGKNIEKTSKIGQLAAFEVNFWKKKGVNENSGSIRLQRKVGPSFNWKEKKFCRRAQTPVKKILIFSIDAKRPH